MAYKEAVEEMESSMSALHAAIDKHKEKAVQQPMNRGFVGDIKHVTEMLNDILAFLGHNKEQ